MPEGVTSENWDFVSNSWKIRPKELPQEKIPQPIEEEEEDEEGFELSRFLSRRPNYRLSQDFGGFFTGEVPDYAIDILGTPSVDASQIKTIFGKTDKALQLVNEFDPSLLSPVSFVFNFSKGGAYGVYLSELDRAIKTKALKKRSPGSP